MTTYTAPKTKLSLDVDVADGKYTVQMGECGSNPKLNALRYGEPWRDCVGDGLIYSLAFELQEAREEIKQLKNKTMLNTTNNTPASTVPFTPDGCVPSPIGLEAQHSDMVEKLIKPGEDIKAQLTAHDCALLHAILGICSEVGELADAIKKAVIYRKPMDLENVVEENGDLEFYLNELRRLIKITREEALRHNMAKLAKRYPNYQYSDQRAQERADKAV